MLICVSQHIVNGTNQIMISGWHIWEFDFTLSAVQLYSNTEFWTFRFLHCKSVNPPLSQLLHFVHNSSRIDFVESVFDICTICMLLSSIHVTKINWFIFILEFNCFLFFLLKKKIFSAHWPVGACAVTNWRDSSHCRFFWAQLDVLLFWQCVCVGVHVLYCFTILCYARITCWLYTFSRLNEPCYFYDCSLCSICHIAFCTLYCPHPVLRIL